MATSDRHRLAAAHLEANRHDEAFELANALLNEEADDPEALYLMGSIHAAAGRMGMAHAFFLRVTQLAPRRPEAWNNLGMSLQHLWRSREARECFQRGLRLKHCAPYLANIATTYVEASEPARAVHFAEQALAIDPTHTGAAITQGFGRLALGDWAQGWKGYAQALGGPHRKQMDYGLPEWQGEPGCRVLVYGEQGLGDEVMYASCLPDLLAISERVALDCDKRLQTLLARSFPAVEVHGTRHEQVNTWCDPMVWTHQCPIGRLPEIFRHDWRDCPGTPYLAANPEFLVMYDALQALWADDRPRIGLAWSGGLASTGGQRREMGIEAWRPFIEAHSEYAFFSLQYRDDAAEQIKASGLPVKHFQAAVGRGAAVDHTAAYLAHMDLVLGPPTTVHHLAGALGVPSVTLVPALHGWMFGAYQGEQFAWFKSCRLFRQRQGEAWIDTVRRFRDEPVVRALRRRSEAPPRLAA